ncbi:hypothetical protein CWB89_21020 [Pseudoalteromonas piscicida]|uniref:Uncharacterized protein n=1 Tax=Pseudoalteromonas piscicida TaxID=43662 RepID=A0AAQ2EQP1_PSEO7|nr:MULTISPECIES: hypothetical protein [Pseudoalteromonas]KJY92682.1 hypothetical protein TW75_01445 [Pseudoalteromonas piscicida]MDP4487249.1 hypothetical protein [Pseudoalteromonas piscicida]TMN34446.1 hypothetical protein CWB94_22750 [Pseudoalteromonas piscicida]TMN41380.1 hypothetical protein CWB95_09035 [Pseudoalteromonas piscicida]TMN46915.1 hypothetical protein CWB91_22405 [Pseudoalteromonas piscicida]
MTTIVYNAKTAEIACDSRTTTDKIIVTDNAQKWFDYHGWRVFCTGQTCDIYNLQHNFLNNQFDTIESLEFIKYHPKKGVWYGCVKRGSCKSEPLAQSYAIGSGQQAAMFGLLNGYNTVEIVEQVKRVDFRTGGDIHCFKVTDPLEHT